MVEFRRQQSSQSLPWWRGPTVQRSAEPQLADGCFGRQRSSKPVSSCASSERMPLLTLAVALTAHCACLLFARAHARARGYKHNHNATW